MWFRACLLGIFVVFASSCIIPTPTNNLSSFTEDTSSQYLQKVVSGNTPGAPGAKVIDKALVIFIDSCGDLLGDKKKCLSSIKPIVLQWSGVIAPSPSSGVLSTVAVLDGVLYNGVTSGNLVIVAWRGKISRTALIHELCHVVGAGVLGDPNKDHTNKKLLLLEQTVNKKLVNAGL